MKATTHDEKGKADCVVKINGASVQEFNTTKGTEPNLFCSWIPIEAGQKISVDAGCNVFTKEVRFDLVIDGIIRSTIPSTSKDWAAKRHNGKFQTAFDMVSGTVTEVEVVAKDLPDDFDGIQQQDEAQETLGTIEVRLWVLQQEQQLRLQTGTKGFLQCCNWRDLDDGDLKYAAIKPTHEVEFPPTTFNPLSSIKITNAKKYLNTERPGEQPWIIFRFYYRSQQAINEGGLLKAPNLTGKHKLRWTPPAASMPGEGEEGGEEHHDDSAEEEEGFPQKSKTEDIGTGPTVTDQAPDSVPRPDLGASDLGSHNALVEDSIPTNASTSSVLHLDTTIIKHEPLPHDTDLEAHDSAIAVPTTEVDPNSSTIPTADTMTAKSRRSTPARRSKTPSVPESDPEREAAIKEYETTVGPIDDLPKEAQDALLEQHAQQQTATPSASASREGIPEPEPATEDKKVAIETAATEQTPTPAPTPVAAKKVDLKRKASSMTPDPAIKIANDERAKKLAEMQKKLAERKAKRLAAQKKFEDEEVSPIRDLERFSIIHAKMFSGAPEGGLG